MGSYRDRESSPRRLYKDRQHKVLCGVCAGIADYFGADRTVIRVLTVLAQLFWPATWVAYLVMCFLLPHKPDALYRDAQDEKFWRDVRVSPKGTFSAARMRFRELEMRVQRMERYVTSSRFNLDREFRDLDK